MKLEIGITNTSFGVYGPVGRYEAIARCGYDCIDFQEFANVYTDFFRLDDEEFLETLRREREVIESHGLRVHQAHAPWVWGETRDHTEEERALWMIAMKKAVRGSSALGARIFVAHPLLPYDNTDKNPEEVFALNESFFAELADYAKEYGVTVCIENLPFKKHPLSSVERVCDLVDKLGRDNVGVCLDTGHAAIFDTDVSAAVRYIGGRLSALHIHDNMGDEDSHLIPGDGVIDWLAFAGALREVGYRGVISLETSPKHGKYPEDMWREREELLTKIALDIATNAN